LKNRKAIVLLFIANGISGFAQGISMLSIPWYFAQQDLSSRFNFIYAIITFITMFWGIFAGTIVDRYNRKNVFLTTNVVEGIILLSIAGYGWYHEGLPMELIILVFTVTIFGYHLHYPNLYAFVQEITPPNQYSKITSYIEIVGQSTNVIAGAFAAFLLEGALVDETFMIFGREFTFSFRIERWEMYEIFTMDGITYFISVCLIIFIKYKSIKNFEIETGRLFKRLKTGFSYLLNNRLIFLFGFFSYAVFVVLLVKLHALMPLYISNHLQRGGGVFGTMEVLYGVGALCAGVFGRRLFNKLPTPLTVIFLLFVASFAFFASSVTRSVPIFFVIGLVIGFANAGTRVFRLAFLFEHIPNNIIGRVNSVLSLTNIMVRVIFIFIFSSEFFGRGSNIIYAYVLCGLFTLFAGVVLSLNYKKLISAENQGKVFNKGSITS
jgi:MFS transporter, DHA3 family, macrolide efflux protein